MDPNAALSLWASLVLYLPKVSKTRQGASHYRLMEQAIEHASHLKEWLERGGSEPRWTPKEKQVFIAWCKKHKVPGRYGY